MNKTLLLIIIIVILLILIASLGIIFVLMIKNRKDIVLNVVEKILQNQSVSLDEINEFLANSIVSKESLNLLSKYFLENFAIPPKEKGEIPSSAKKHFDFISLFAASKNADAKMISAFNRDLRVKNPSYGDEIDTIETKGIKSRK